MEHLFEKTSKKCLELAKNVFYKWKEKEIKSTQRRQLSTFSNDQPCQSSSPVSTVSAATSTCLRCHRQPHHHQSRHQNPAQVTDDATVDVSDAETRVAGRRRRRYFDEVDVDEIKPVVVNDGGRGCVCNTKAAAVLGIGVHNVVSRKRRVNEIRTPAYERQMRNKARTMPYRRRPVRRLEFGPPASSFMRPRPAALFQTAAASLLMAANASSPVYYGSPQQSQIQTTNIRPFVAEKVGNGDSGLGIKDRVEERGAVAKARSLTDSPILMNTVKIVVQPPAPLKGRKALNKANRSNPCVVSAAEAEKDGIVASSSLDNKRSVSDTIRRSKRLVPGARSKSTASVASPSVLDTESCENLINERLELRSTRSLSFGRRSRSRSEIEVEGLTTIDTSAITVPTAASGRRSEWDDDDDAMPAGNDEQVLGAVGGPLISASVRV